MALLQGFPSNYIFEGPLPAKYNQIGDAVPPLIADVIARCILTAKGRAYSEREPGLVTAAH